MDPMREMGLQNMECNQVSVDINHYWVLLACKQEMFDFDETFAST